MADHRLLFMEVGLHGTNKIRAGWDLSEKRYPDNILDILGLKKHTDESHVIKGIGPELGVTTLIATLKNGKRARLICAPDKTEEALEKLPKPANKIQVGEGTGDTASEIESVKRGSPLSRR